MIQSGVENLDSGVGIYAPDAEAYSVFAPIFDPVIEDYHGGFSRTDMHPPPTYEGSMEFGDLDPDGRYIVSTRIRCGRSIKGIPFNPNMSEDDYLDMEKKVSEALSKLGGDLAGEYKPLDGMDPDEQRQLIDQHFLFKEGDRFLAAANSNRYWPKGRGIFFNDDRTFLVWCAEEDHMRIISMQEGGNVGEVYRRLIKAINSLSKNIEFSHDDRLGFLTFCPTNLGTTIR